MLFTMGTLSIYTVYTTGEKSSYYAAQRIRALYIAKGIIQTLYAKDYKEIKSHGKEPIEDFSNFSSAIIVKSKKSISKTYEMAKNIRVEVYYDVQGAEEKVYIETLFYKL